MTYIVFHFFFFHASHLSPFPFISFLCFFYLSASFFSFLRPLPLFIYTFFHYFFLSSLSSIFPSLASLLPSLASFLPFFHFRHSFIGFFSSLASLLPCFPPYFLPSYLASFFGFFLFLIGLFRTFFLPLLRSLASLLPLS